MRTNEQGRSAREDRNTWQNAAVAAALRVARGVEGQREFAERLSAQLDYRISPQALSGYEAARRGIPSAVLVAAAMIAEVSVERLFMETGFPNEALLAWLDVASPFDRATARAIGELQVQMAEVRGRLGIPDEVGVTRVPAELPLPSRRAPRSSASRPRSR